MAAFPDQGTPQPDLGAFTLKLVVGQHVVYYDHLDDGIVVLRIFHGRENVEPFLTDPDR